MPILTNSDYDREIRLRSRSSGAAVDLTDFALELVIKAQRGDLVALATLAIGSGLAVPAPASGCVELSLTAQQTDAIGAGDRVWGLYRVDGGRRLALATGKMRVTEGV